MPFNTADYEALTGSVRSAAIVLPLVFDLVGRPAAVVDFGCGIGGWLAAARDLGVTDYVGLEGGHPEDGALLIDRRQVRQVDLEQPVDLGRRFDLAICVEVGEHLREPCAARIVSSIARHADVVVWSAAIAGQGGIGHVNEQWPGYWHRLWAAEGFECFDVLRWPVWADRRVDAWFRQNLLLYSRRPIEGCEPCEPAAVVHPALYERVTYLLGERRPKPLRSHVREALWSLRHRRDPRERPELDWPL